MATNKPERNAGSEPGNSSRREFFQKAAYIAPVLLTFPVSPSLAGSGSFRDRDDDSKRKWRRWRRWWYHFFGP